MGHHRKFGDHLYLSAKAKEFLWGRTVPAEAQLDVAMAANWQVAASGI